MSFKITQFQIAPEAFTGEGYDIAADWVYNPSSDMYRKYRNLNREDFIKLMIRDGDEVKMTKRQLFPIGAALIDRGSLSDIVPIVVDFDGTICPVFNVFGYIGLNLTRDQIVDDIMDKLRNG